MTLETPEIVLNPGLDVPLGQVAKLVEIGLAVQGELHRVGEHGRGRDP